MDVCGVEMLSQLWSDVSCNNVYLEECPVTFDCFRCMFECQSWFLLLTYINDCFLSFFYYCFLIFPEALPFYFSC